MGRAARLAHAFAPELVAVLPTLVDPRSHRLRLVPGLTSAGGGLGTGDDDTDDDNAAKSNGSGPMVGGLSGSGALPWLDFDAYTNVALFDGSRGTRWGSSEAATNSSMSRSESLQALQSSLGSTPSQAQQSFALTPSKLSAASSSSKSNGGSSSASSSSSSSEWVLSATRESDGRKVLLKGFGARKSYLPKRPARSIDTSQSSLDWSSNSESGDTDRRSLLSPGSIARSRLATEDDMNSG